MNTITMSSSSMQLRDTIILFLFSCIAFFQINEEPQPETTVCLLCAVSFSFLAEYISPKKPLVVLFFLFLGVSFFFPKLVLFFPVLLYHMIRFQISRGMIIIAILFLPFYKNEFPIHIFLLYYVLCLLSVFLCWQMAQINELIVTLLQARDYSEETRLSLRKKNKDLLEKQDYEIHLATLRERNRIAREIHDHVGHMLSRCILQTGALTMVHEEEPLHSQLASIGETLDAAMNNIRESVHDLHDDSVDLRQSILEAVRELRDSYEIQLDYDISGKVPKEIKYCFISIIKEALSNTVRHASATQIHILLREHPGLYQLAIEDNGKNARLPSEEERGIGLSNMCERVEALGGTIHFHAEDGFHIFISIQKQPEHKGGSS